MKRTEVNELAFWVDRLTNSIQKVDTGESLVTEVKSLKRSDLKCLGKKMGWLFNWKDELKYDTRLLFKLATVADPDIVQGLLSLEIKSDHVYIHLIESARFNKGRAKKHWGVPGNLVAYACKLSFQNGFDGNVAFLSKTSLIEHYQNTLGARHFGGRIMIIETAAAKQLVEQYFQNQ